jgi:hypothetical protein
MFFGSLRALLFCKEKERWRSDSVDCATRGTSGQNGEGPQQFLHIPYPGQLINGR